jgi:hypothetical protein
MSNALMLKHARLVCFGLGLAVGLLLLLAGLCPNTPLHAVATDRSDSFLMATGPLDESIEGIYVLDCLTGELRGAALSRQSARFNAFFQGNVAKDLNVDQTKNPRYMMVTGMADLMRTGGNRVAPSKAILYVAEITTGKVAAYAVRWSPGVRVQGQPQQGPFVLLDMFPMRTMVAPAGRAND